MWTGQLECKTRLSPVSTGILGTQATEISVLSWRKAELPETAAEYQCPTRRKLAPPVQVPKTTLRTTYRFNERLLSDTIWLQILDKTTPLLTMMDAATRYVAARVLRRETSSEFLQALERGWIRVFGRPSTRCLAISQLFRAACWTPTSTIATSTPQRLSNTSWNVECARPLPWSKPTTTSACGGLYTSTTPKRSATTSGRTEVLLLARGSWKWAQNPLERPSHSVPTEIFHEEGVVHHQLSGLHDRHHSPLLVRVVVVVVVVASSGPSRAEAGLPPAVPEASGNVIPAADVTTEAPRATRGGMGRQAWQDLDHIDVQAELRQPVPTLQDVPFFLRAGVRRALVFALQAVRDADLGEGVHGRAPCITPTRTWTLFMLTPRMLLVRPGADGAVGRCLLHERVDRYERGDWPSLPPRADPPLTAQTVRERRRRATRSAKGGSPRAASSREPRATCLPAVRWRLATQARGQLSRTRPSARTGPACPSISAELLSTSCAASCAREAGHGD